MLSILLRNATETQDSVHADKALKALRGKPVTSNEQAIDEMHSSAIKRRAEAEYKEDSQRLNLLVGGKVI